jgi:hypothetical protein
LNRSVNAVDELLLNTNFSISEKKDDHLFGDTSISPIRSKETKWVKVISACFVTIFEQNIGKC